MKINEISKENKNNEYKRDTRREWEERLELVLDID